MSSTMAEDDAKPTEKYEVSLIMENVEDDEECLQLGEDQLHPKSNEEVMLIMYS
jgi:hypothetical protein